MNLDLAKGDEAREWLAELDGGSTWRDALERHLLRIELVRAERTMQLLKEGRGAYVVHLLGPGEPGARRRAWVVGNALSGTLVVLDRLGFDVTAFAPDTTRARVAAHRDRVLGSGRATFRTLDELPGTGDGQAPDVAIVEGPLPREHGSTARLARELASRGARQVVVVVDNRFAYKRSTGVRADLRVQSPWRFAANALFGRDRSIRGWRRVVGGGRATRAAAPYPHRWDYSLVVGLDGRGPNLFLGPGERTNRAKMLAHRLGLFPLLAPSFAVASPPSEPSFQEHWLARLEELVDEAPGRVDHFVATRGSNVLLMTSGRRAGGRWVVRFPMGPDQERQTRRHGAHLERLERLDLPAPRLLFQGRVDGVFLQVERRLDGINAAQLVDERDRQERTLPGCSRLLARLRTTEPVPLAETELERLVVARAELVARRAGREETAAALRTIGRECADALRGVAVPRVLLHGDMRAKHVAVAPDGEVLGLLDAGCARERDLPYFDLLNLVLHDRKDDAGSDLGSAWREALAHALPEPMERALDDHAARLDLPRVYTDAMRAAYPIFVGHSAESCWDYSRPRWIHRQLGI
ncbi:MAG: phosphotransferase [Planctomycetota bacterium]